MTETDSTNGKSSGIGSGGRGPSYPFITLQEAISRTQKFFDNEGKNAAPVAAAVEHWGYGSKSSGGRQTVATLLQYGLLRDEGSGEQRRIALSKLGLEIVLREKGSKEQREAIKQAAQQPKLYKDLLSKYGQTGLPSDATLRHYLIADKDVPTGAVGALIKNFRANLAFAGLLNPGSIPAAEDASKELPKTSPKVGDFIQWESAGVLQFESPRRVRAIQDHDGQQWLFVEGSDTGIPGKEVTLSQTAPASDAKKPLPPPPVLPEGKQIAEKEWLRGSLSADTSYRLIVSGDLGPKEIGKLIKLLEAQKAVLSDDEEEN